MSMNPNVSLVVFLCKSYYLIPVLQKLVKCIKLKHNKCFMQDYDSILEVIVEKKKQFHRSVIIYYVCN